MLSENTAEIYGRRLEHIHKTLGAKEKDTLVVGLENDQVGTANITHLEKAKARLTIQWHSPPPPALPVTLIIGLPRPKMLKRIIQTATTMGVKDLYFIHSWKVEKSFWHSPWLKDEKIRDNCILGLEQAKDTIMPRIHLRKRFKPFVEDELPSISENTLKLVAHPGEAKTCPLDVREAITLAIGPEGGFTPYEVEKIKEVGFEGIHLGPRILRVETAVPTLLAKLF